MFSHRKATLCKLALRHFGAKPTAKERRLNCFVNFFNSIQTKRDIDRMA